MEAAIEQITAANHYLNWDCLEQVAKKHPGGFRGVVERMKDNRAYYERVFQQAADKLLSGKASLAIWIREAATPEADIKGISPPAWCHPGISETIWISKHYFPLLTDAKKKDEAINVLVHELGRLYASQTGKDFSGKPGDPYEFDIIVSYLNTYRSEIDECMKRAGK
jgi:hypothetical protein